MATTERQEASQRESAWKDGDGFANVVVPLDGTPMAERAVRVAINATAPHATVHLVRVIPSNSMGTPGDLPAVVAATDCPSPDYAMAGGQFTSDLEQASEYLETVAERYAVANRDVVWEVRHGSPYNQALEAVRDNEADAVVVAQRAASPLKRLLEPDLAKFLADRLDQPVVVCLVPRNAA